MRYERLIQKVAELADIPEDHVRKTIRHLPTALMDLQPGQSIRTPLGVFSGIYRERRKIHHPVQGITWAAPKFLVKLKESRVLETTEVD